MFEQYLTKTLGALLVPPGLIILGLCCGLVARRWWPRTGMFLLLICTFTLYALSTQLCANALSRTLLLSAPLSPSDSLVDAEAIVVPGAGIDNRAIEYVPHGHSVSVDSLVRLRYAAALHRRSGLPILLCGGTLALRGFTQAGVMATVLKEAFGIAPRWLETRSLDTRECALRTSELLLQENIHHVVVVSHALRMERTAAAFEKFGLRVTAAPTALPSMQLGSPGGGRAPGFHPYWSLLPEARAFQTSCAAIHEIMARAWHAVSINIGLLW